jgi:hypothetical protein
LVWKTGCAQFSAQPQTAGHATVAYFVGLPDDESQWLDPTFEGGKDLELDMVVPAGHLVRGMNLEGCLRYHVRVPPELVGAVPTRIVVTLGQRGYLPDFGIAPWGGWKLVSQGFVDVVEELEPGEHEFLPIAETVDSKGQMIGKRYFLMNILQQFNAVNVERSSVEFRTTHHALVVNGKREEFTVTTMGLVKPCILTLNRKIIAGHHLWHGTAEDIYLAFFSQELHDAVHAAGLSSLKYFHAEEV